MKPLTKNQKIVLEAIMTATIQTGSSPSLAALTEHTVGSKRNTHRYIGILVREGYVQKCGRSLKVVRDQDGNPISLAFVGEQFAVVKRKALDSVAWSLRDASEALDQVITG